MNRLKWELRHSTSCTNAKATNEVESADLAYFNPKIGCHANVSWAIGKKSYDQIPTMWWKVGVQWIMR